MNRSQKKSVVVSTGLHLSLFGLVIFVGSAFHSIKPPAPEPPPIDFIALKTTDTDHFGGGSPKPAGNPAPPTVAPAPAPTPAPPVVTPTPPKPIPHVATPPPPKPKPEHIEAVKEPVKAPIKETIKDVAKNHAEDPAEPIKPKPTKPSADSIEPASKPTRRKPSIDPQLTTRESAPDVEAQKRRADAERKRREWEQEQREQQREEQRQEQEAARQAQIAAQQRQERISRLAGDVKHIGEGLPTSGTAVHLEGPGGEGVPYANFLSAVQYIYQRDWHQRIQRGISESEVSAWATVTIARDGTVLEAKITRPSGNRDVDESVNATLNAVRVAAPLPEKAKENQRSVTIEFNVKPKRSLG